MSQAENLRLAIGELLEGSIGSGRVLTPGLFTRGVFEGLTTPAQQARTIVVDTVGHRFSVQISTARTHRATPMSSKANYRIESRQVSIRVYTHLSSSADAQARFDILSRVEQNCSDAIGVLSYPGNLTQTFAGEPTGLASGMLCGAEDGTGIPRWELVSEDWKRQLHTSRITGTAILSVPQAVS